MLPLFYSVSDVVDVLTSPGCRIRGTAFGAFGAAVAGAGAVLASQASWRSTSQFQWFGHGN